MRGKKQMWKGLPHVYITTKPFFLLSRSQAQKAGWAITDSACTAYSNSRLGGLKYQLYHLGYCTPIRGEKAAERRAASGFTEERCRELRERYPRQLRLME